MIGSGGANENPKKSTWYFHSLLGICCYWLIYDKYDKIEFVRTGT